MIGRRLIKLPIDVCGHVGREPALLLLRCRPRFCITRPHHLLSLPGQAILHVGFGDAAEVFEDCSLNSEAPKANLVVVSLLAHRFRLRPQHQSFAMANPRRVFPIQVTGRCQHPSVGRDRSFRVGTVPLQWDIAFAIYPFGLLTQFNGTTTPAKC
jgi:hypothetical protein